MNIFGLKGMLIAAGLSAVLAFGGGWKVRDAFCDSAAAKKEVALLKGHINELNKLIEQQRAALEQDAAKGAEQAAEIEKLERKIRDAEKSVSRGVCLPATDTDRLRDLWN